MIDPVSTAIDALTRHDLARVPVVFFAGLITSAGPCIVPRYVVLAAALDGTPRRWATIGAFAAGLLVAYATLAFGVGVLAAISRQTELIELGLCIALVASGIATLVRPPSTCGHRRASRVRRLSGVFSLGATSVLVVSPCCTPIVAAIVGMSAFDRVPWMTAVFLAAFALGHTTPLLFAGILDSAVVRRLRPLAAGGAAAVVSGTLMIALGAYYGLLV